ncbi:Mce associated membrane protein [Mycobacterium sp. smrl_JER01]
MAAESVTEVPADTDDRNITAASTEVPMDAAAMHSGQAEGQTAPNTKTVVEVGGTASAPGACSPRHIARVAVTFGVAALLALSVLVGWLGIQTYDATREENQRVQFLAAGRDSAVRLTTINPDNADAEVTKILQSSIGLFHEDFDRRSADFVEAVKRAQSRTEGTVIEAGLEAADGDHADVLVAISVKTWLAGIEAPARLWRMRISVQRVGSTEKVSNVQYVP